MSARYVSDILPSLSIDWILEVAGAIEAQRPRLDEVRDAWAGRASSVTTPFELRLGLVARELGTTMPVPRERKIIGRFDQRSLVQRLVGFGWWPGQSEWELMHLERFTLGLQAFHTHYLADVGRLDDAGLALDRLHPRASERARLKRLQEDARAPATRRARLTNAASRGLVDRGLQVLGYELYAFRSGLFGGRLAEPTGPYLELGHVADEARGALLERSGPGFQRWIEHCLEPGRDFASTAAMFEQRVARVLGALLTPEIGEADEASRARAVLQDVGYRICQQPEPLTRSLVAIADAIRSVDQCREESSAEDSCQPALDGIVAAALEVVVADAGRLALPILALGYMPTRLPEREPEAVRDVRSAVLVQRAWGVHAALGAALAKCPALADAIVSGARKDDHPDGAVDRDLLDELAVTSEALTEELPALTDGYFDWLRIAFTDVLGDALEPEAAGQRWHYRLAHRHLPIANHADFEVMANPYLVRVPLTFDAPWNDALMRGALDGGAFKPRQSRSTWYCQVGPGRDGLVYLPLVPRASGLLHALRVPRRLDALLADPDFGPAFVAQSVSDEAVLLLHKPDIKQPERPLDFYDQIGVGTDAGDQPGPWNEPAQADAYAAFCERSEHYQASSRALCAVAAIEPGARVGELGFGTGQTSRAILERLGPEGTLVAVDPAPLMVARAGRYVQDRRARFELGNAATLAWTAIYESGFERIVANASIWLAPDVTVALTNLRRAAAPGGRVALSIPAEFLGMRPANGDLFAAIGAARTALGLETPPRVALDPALGSVAAFSAALTAAGWKNPRVEVFEHAWTLGEQLAWTSLPVVAERLLVEAEREHVPALLARVAEMVDPEVALVASWYLVTAEHEEER